MLGLRITIVIFTALVACVWSYSTGAPDNLGICSSMTPGHKPNPPQSQPLPFVIEVNRNTYTYNSELTVTIRATGSYKLRGFLIKARRVDKTLDRDEAIGYFNQLPGTKVICNSDHGLALTHTDGKPGSDELKASLNLTWTAPKPSQGHIQFWVTVVSQFDTYWVGERSVIVEDINADPIPSTTPGKVVPKEMLSSPIDTTDCGKTKGCYRNPRGCAEPGCAIVVTWRDRGDYVDFELSADSEGWVAVGFSKDKKMGDDDVYECVWNDETSEVEVRTSYNVQDGRMNTVNRLDDQSDILLNPESQKNEGRIRCRFSRLRSLTGSVSYRADFNKEYHILLARGTVDQGGVKERHVLEPNKYPYVSRQKVQLAEHMDVDIDNTARYFLVKIHGCLMLIAWMLCAPVALIMAKYYKLMWPNDPLCREKVWFAVHRGCMIVTLVCTVIAFIIIFLHVWGYSHMPDLPDKAHPILGIIVTICCVINPLLAICRCNPKSSYRPIFNWIHWFFGTVGSVLAVPTLFIGLNLHKAFVPWWATWVMVAFMLFHLVIELMLEIHGCVNAKKQKYRSEEFEMRKKNVDGREYQGLFPEPVGTHFKKRILTVYLVVAVILSLVMIITVAVC